MPISRNRSLHSSLCCLVTLTSRLENFSAFSWSSACSAASKAFWASSRRSLRFSSCFKSIEPSDWLDSTQCTCHITKDSWQNGGKQCNTGLSIFCLENYLIPVTNWHISCLKSVPDYNPWLKSGCNYVQGSHRLLTAGFKVFFKDFQGQQQLFSRIYVKAWPPSSLDGQTNGQKTDKRMDGITPTLKGT